MKIQLKAILATCALYALFTLRAQAADGAALTGVTLPSDYRTWQAAAPSMRTDKNFLRLMLVNPIMAEAYRKGTLPFPEGSMIAKLSYDAAPSTTWDAAIVPGEAKGVEIMVKDSKKYPHNAGWGFGSFTPEGKPTGSKESYATCFPCHEVNATKSVDYIFTRWAP